MGRILAIDYGEKRFGIAFSNETKKISLPQPYILRSQIGKLFELLKKKDVEIIVLGLPRSLAGQETKSAKRVRSFGAWLSKETELPIIFIDEWFSSKEAARKLREQNIKGAVVKRQIDSLAAHIILDVYLKRFRN